MVLDALVASVACTCPLVKRHSKKVSIVPKASFPSLARSRAHYIVQNPGHLGAGKIWIYY